MLAVTAIPVPHVQYSVLLPELIAIGGALGLLGVSGLSKKRLPDWANTCYTAFVGLACVGTSVWQWVHVEDHGSSTAVAAAIAVDGFSAFFLILISVALVLAALISQVFLDREPVRGSEFYVLAMLSASGAMFMAAANDLIVIFLGLEIMSIALYVLAGINSRRAESGEAAMKYFVLGAFSSAIFLYGVALTYGATGTTNLPRIADFLANNVIASNGVLLAGLALMLVGFGFKVAAVPFHTWTPDVYQGSPSPVTGYMAAVAKAGGFAGLIRVFVTSFSSLRLDWQPLVWALAVLTLVAGAVLALVQRDVKRMLAYSSINHAGFVLIGLQAASATGTAGSLYYLFAYTFLVMGSFAVVTVVAKRGDAAHSLEDYRGLSRRNPWLAGALTLFLLAQAGIPFTTGFLAKFYVIAAAVQARSYALAVIGMVSAAVAAFFYLRLVFLMYTAPGAAGIFDQDVDLSPESPVAAEVSTSGGAAGGVAVATHAAPTRRTPRLIMPPSTALALFVCAGVTVVLGLWPGPLFDFAHKATLLF